MIHRRIGLVLIGVFLGVSLLSAQDLSSEFESTSNATETSILAWIHRRNPKISSEDAHLIASTIVEVAPRYEMDPLLVASIISIESGFNHKAYHAGTMGLGQLLKGTANRVGVSDPYSITQNIEGTTRYLKKMMDIWADYPDQTDLALASYHRGPDAIKRAKKPLTGRGKHYASKVMQVYAKMNL